MIKPTPAENVKVDDRFVFGENSCVYVVTYINTVGRMIFYKKLLDSIPENSMGFGLWNRLGLVGFYFPNPREFTFEVRQ